MEGTRDRAKEESKIEKNLIEKMFKKIFTKRTEREKIFKNVLN